MAAPIFIRTFGNYCIGSIPAAHADRNAAGVLACLVTSAAPFPRAKLFDLLWDTQKIASPSHSLSQALYSLKRLVPDGVISTKEGLHVNSAAITSDFEELSVALNEGRDTAVLELYRGRFLADFRYITDEYDDWKLNIAARVHGEVLSARWRQIRRSEATEEHARVAELALDGLRLDPLDVALARTRVLSLLEVGERDQAEVELRRYQREHLLEDNAVPQPLRELDHLICERTVVALPTFPSTAFIGRSREATILEDLWHQARSGSRTVVISGEPGIGKTRLLQHSLRRIAISGGRVLSHAASEGVASLPNSTLTSLLQDGFRRGDDKHIDANTAARISELIPELPRPANGAPPDLNRTAYIEPIATYLKSIACRMPLAVSVDNLQWVDESSRSVLAYLSQRLADYPILFIYAARGRGIEVPVFEDKYLQTTRIELEELSKSDVDALIRSYADRHGEPGVPELPELLYEKVGGRPFFIVEALRILSNAPISRREEWYNQLVRSPVLVQHFAERLAHMPQVAVLLAKAAALINRPVSLELLTAIIDVPVTEAAQATAHLVAAGVFRSGRDIEFAHDLIREAVAHQVPAYEAALWHARIAKRLLGQENGLQEVAAHFERAGYMDEAYRYAFQAAKAAGWAGAYREEEEQYHRMLRCAPAGYHRDALYALTRLWVRTGHFLKLEPYLDRLRRALSSCPDGEIAVACAVAEMELNERSNRLSSSDLAESAKVVIELAACAGPEVLAQIIWYVAEHCRRSKQFRLMEQVAETLSYHATRLDSKSKVEATAATALLIATCRGFAAAMDGADSAVDLAESCNDDLIVCRARFARGTVRLWSGDLHAARHDYECTMKAADRVGATQVLLAARANLSVVMAEQGDFETAIQCAQQCLLEGGSRQRAFAYGNLALIHLRQPDYEAVRHYAAALVECNRTSPEAWIPAHAAGFQGLADLQSGNLSEAIKQAAFVAARLHVADSVGDVSHLHILRARVEVASGRKESASALLSAAAKVAESKDYIAARRLQLEQASLAGSRSAVIRRIVEGIAAEARYRGAYSLSLEAEHILSRCD